MVTKSPTEDDDETLASAVSYLHSLERIHVYALGFGDRLSAVYLQQLASLPSGRFVFRAAELDRETVLDWDTCSLVAGAKESPSLFRWLVEEGSGTETVSFPSAPHTGTYGMLVAGSQLQ